MFVQIAKDVQLYNIVMDKKLTIIYLNIRSHRNKQQYLEATLNEKECDADLIVITEIKLYKNEIQYMNLCL